MRFWNQVEKEKEVEKKRGGWRQEWVYVCGGEKTREKKKKKRMDGRKKNNIKNKK